MALICAGIRSEEHTSELQSQSNLVCRLLLEKKIDRNLGPPLHGHGEFNGLQYPPEVRYPMRTALLTNNQGSAIAAGDSASRTLRQPLRSYCDNPRQSGCYVVAE